MVRDPLDQFAKIISTYATLPRGTLPSSLDRDFKRFLKALPTEHIANLLEWTIQSPQTPPFSEIFGLLYRHSSKRIQADLIKTILAYAPAFKEFLPQSLNEKRPISPKAIEVIPLDKVVEFATDAAPQEPFVDLVCHQFARHSEVLLNLEPRVRGFMLKTLATDPQVAADAPLQPTPPPRYASIQAFRESSDSNRAAELLKDQPFRMGQWYQLEVSVRLNPVDLPPSKERRPLREPKQTHDVRILVVAESIPNGAAATRKCSAPRAI
jgi:hypothetical protein